MLLTIFLVLFFLLITYLLLVPVVLFINTNTNEYYVQIKGFIKGNIEADKKELFRIKIKVFFFNFSIYPLKKTKKINKDNKPNNNELKKNKKRMSFKAGLRLLKSFKIKKLRLNIDTGDCITNAKLYPLFAFLNFKVGGFNINFNGENQLVLKIQNRPINIIKSFINI
jgi:hypothetical protein